MDNHNDLHKMALLIEARLQIVGALTSSLDKSPEILTGRMTTQQRDLLSAATSACGFERAYCNAILLKIRRQIEGVDIDLDDPLRKEDIEYALRTNYEPVVKTQEFLSSLITNSAAHLGGAD